MIRGARQLLTMRGARGPRCGSALNELGIIQDGALLIRDGVLEEVGPTRRVENLSAARNAEEINAAGCVVMPGFVDSHTHLLFATPSEAGPELAPQIRATSASSLEARARTHLQTMARHGTTTVEVKTGTGPDASAEIKLLRVAQALKRDPLDVAPTFLFHLPDAGGNESRDAADWTFRELMPKIRRRRLARHADVAWDRDPERNELLGRCFDVALRLGFACKVHADTADPAAAITAAVANFAISVDHLEHATAVEAALLAGSCTVATLLPPVSFHDGLARSGARPYAPARSLIDLGAAVALASNFHPRHTPTPSMQTVVALACRYMGMTPAEAIVASTINGAHALGRADRVGSLEPGKQADVLILNGPDYRALAHEFGVNLVRATIKRGDTIYEEGEVARRTELPAPRAQRRL